MTNVNDNYATVRLGFINNEYYSHVNTYVCIYVLINVCLYFCQTSWSIVNYCSHNGVISH